MIFVDTGAWFASIVPWDTRHAAAAVWLGQNQERLLRRAAVENLPEQAAQASAALVCATCSWVIFHLPLALAWTRHYACVGHWRAATLRP